MKKNFTKMLSLALAFIMLLSLAACGSGSGKSDEAEKSSETNTEPSAEKSSEAGEEQEAADSEAGGEESGEAGDQADAGTSGADAEETVWGLTPFAETQSIRVGFMTGSPLSYPYLFAENLGIFDKLNIDVEFTMFTTGPAMMEANAEWDMASAGLGGICVAFYGYDNLRLIDVNDYEQNMAIFAQPDSAIAANPEDPASWEGATAIYAMGTTNQAVLAIYLQSIGMQLSDIESVNIDVANCLTAFIGGTGDVMVVPGATAFSADAEGFVRITDAGKMGLPFPCCTVAQVDFMNENPDLMAYMAAVFHKAVEWLYESDENMQQGADWYLEHCNEEGYKCDEDTALKSMQWYRGSTVEEYVELFTHTAPDETGIYTARDLLDIENNLLVGYDFFVSEGKYTEADREQFLDENRVDNSVALRVAELLGVPQ